MTKPDPRKNQLNQTKPSGTMVSDGVIVALIIHQMAKAKTILVIREILCKNIHLHKFGIQRYVLMYESNFGIYEYFKKRTEAK